MKDLCEKRELLLPFAWPVYLALNGEEPAAQIKQPRICLHPFWRMEIRQLNNSSRWFLGMFSSRMFTLVLK